MWKVEEKSGGKRLAMKRNASLEWVDMEEEGQASENKGEKEERDMTRRRAKDRRVVVEDEKGVGDVIR
jgi:hypothetical protein